MLLIVNSLLGILVSAFGWIKSIEDSQSSVFLHVDGMNVKPFVWNNSVEKNLSSFDKLIVVGVSYELIGLEDYLGLYSKCP